MSGAEIPQSWTNLYCTYKDFRFLFESRFVAGKGRHSPWAKTWEKSFLYMDSKTETANQSLVGTQGAESINSNECQQE
jgi:hypothetical protein